MPANADHGGGCSKEGQDARKLREKARVAMKQISDQEAFRFLSQAGFMLAEIKHLSSFRQSYQISDLDQPALDRRRLEFARWLVKTGRLTEQLPEVREAAVSPRSDATPDIWSRTARPSIPFFWRKEASGR